MKKKCVDNNVSIYSFTIVKVHFPDFLFISFYRSFLGVTVCTGREQVYLVIKLHNLLHRSELIHENEKNNICRENVLKDFNVLIVLFIFKRNTKNGSFT